MCLTVSQTSPGFRMSVEKDLLYKAISPFPTNLKSFSSNSFTLEESRNFCKGKG